MLTNILLIASSIVTLGMIISIIWHFTTKRRLSVFFRGKDAKTLEDTLKNISSELDTLKSAHNALVAKSENMNKRLRRSIQGVETIRFNPFPDQGGNHSFAISFLSEEGDGVVVSSLYSRERMSFFAKPIKKNASQFELTEEENEALEKSKLKD